MSAESPWIWSLDACFPSVRGGGQYLLAELLTALKREKWNADDIFAVHLAVEEALVNAICHGNRSDHSKHVSLNCKLAADRVVVEVADEGPGFDPERVPDCTAPEHLKRPCGRGIKLMRSYMSRVEYTDGGHRVVMEKQRSAGN
jgi:serine/threonine-protein kinase RsbW